MKVKKRESGGDEKEPAPERKRKREKEMPKSLFLLNIYLTLSPPCLPIMM